MVTLAGMGAAALIAAPGGSMAPGGVASSPAGAGIIVGGGA
jgi:hypothetical protein